MSKPTTSIVLARCDHCGEPYHETLIEQWLDGASPRCGFCGLLLTQDDDAVKDEALYRGVDWCKEKPRS